MIEQFKSFIDELATTNVSPNAYNQYSYYNEENLIRRNNLLIYLKNMYKLKPRIILIGEAPGYRGCCLTGVPFTSEHMLMHNMPGLDLFGRVNGYELAQKKDKLLKEATATIIWETLIKLEIWALGWNAFPFHPHKKDNGRTNRTPLKGEILLGQRFLLQMIDMFDIEMIVAVGNKAEGSLRSLGINCYKVRHPAQGGKNKFVRGMELIGGKEHCKKH